MRSRQERARTTHSNAIPRPRLLLSAALAALLVAAPAGHQASAQMQMMGLRPSLGGGGAVTGVGGLGGGGFNSGRRSFVPTGHVGHIAIGEGPNMGVVGRGDPRRGPSGNPCKPGRGTRCVVNNGGDHPGGGESNASFFAGVLLFLLLE